MVLALGGCLARQEAPSAGNAQEASAPAGKQRVPDPNQANVPSTTRKVLRTAELSLEVQSPAAAEARVRELVERLGGYVANSERVAHADENERQNAGVSVTLRVPADKLSVALRELKRLGAGAETERLGSEDVTDEYIDLEARIANQRHLEVQLVALLAKTSTVESALKVHQELASVRTEIDRMEGRRRFLTTETELAKISLTLAPLPRMVAISLGELGASVRRASSDSVAVAAAIATGCIRLAGVMLPLVLLFGLPRWACGVSRNVVNVVSLLWSDR